MVIMGPYTFPSHYNRLVHKSRSALHTIETKDWELTYNDTILSISKDGGLAIKGKTSDAAKALFDYVLHTINDNKGKTPSYIILGKFVISFDPDMVLICPYQNGFVASEDFFALKMEFDKMAKLLVFL